MWASWRSYTRFFYKQHFFTQHEAGTDKKANAKQDLEAELLQFENYSLSFSRYDLKIVGYILKNVLKKKCVLMKLHD